MKKNFKKSAILILTMMLIFSMLIGTSSVFAGGGNDNIGKITIQWHRNGDRGYYNPADEGKDISFWYIFGFNGKDKDGNMKTGLFAQRMYSGKIGETKVYEIDLSSVKDQKGDTYTDCEFNGLYLSLYKGNTKYGASRDEKSKEITALLQQNMETHTKMTVEDGSIILESDKNNMPVLFDIEYKEEGKDSEYPFKNKQNLNAIKRTLNFEEGEIDLSLDDDADDYSFYRAVNGNSLQTFNPWTPRVNEYKLHANFTGNRKDLLEERYTLAMSGNDIDGWNLVLKSKIKEGMKEEVAVEDFKTVYEDDPTLPVGKTKVKQKGVKGKTVTKTTYYYLPTGNGGEKILEVKDPVVEKTEPVNKIVLRGTKKVPAGDDTNPGQGSGNSQNNASPKTGDSENLGIFAVGLILTLTSAYAVIGYKRKEDR